MSFEPVWGGIIAWYLFLAGLGGGAFATSAFLAWKHPEAVKLRKIGHLIAPIVVIIGLVLLMVDAEGGFQNPLRFVLLALGFNFSSVMSWGVVFLALFVVVALVVVLLDFLKIHVPVWLDVVGVIFALCVGAYTGALLGVVKTYPLWNNALLPILFLVSALSTGAAAVLFSSAFGLKKEYNEIGTFKKFHIAFPIVEIVLVASLLFITSSTGTAGWDTVISLVTGTWSQLFWIGFVGIGLVLPTLIELVLLFILPKSLEESTVAHYFGVAASLGYLVGGFLLRYLVIVAALPIVFVW
jgi:formate-dependent nitrite reductase membrane component NrfD